MTALMTRPCTKHRTTDAATRRTRIDAPVLRHEVYPEALYLRRWASRQVAGYQDLLLTIAAATKPARNA